MTNLFPIIQPEAEPSVQARLPLCREVAWDFVRGIPIYAGGRPVEVTGAEAVKVWIWKATRLSDILLMMSRFLLWHSRS